MRIICERTCVLPPDSGSDGSYALYELSHDSNRPSISPSRGAWRILVRYSNIVSLEKALLDADAERYGLQRLSRFAPYRLGASDRADVVAERARGISRFLEHALKTTEPPVAPTRLTALMDTFVVAHRLCGADAPSPGFVDSSTPIERALEPQSYVTEVAGAGDCEAGAPSNAHDFDLGWLLPDTPVGEFRPVASSAATKTPRGAKLRSGGAVIAGHTWTADAIDAKPLPWRYFHVEPFVEQLSAIDAAHAICELCGEHLRRLEARVHQGRADTQLKGCVRLRTCGHEFHSVCFTDFIRNRRPRAKPRARCPVCSEQWVQWAKLPAPELPLDKRSHHARDEWLPLSP